MMNAPSVSRIERFFAAFSVRCLVCRRARRQQSGFAFWLVKSVERHICPFCRAYAKVYGRESHQAVPGTASEPNRRGDDGPR